MSTHEFIAKKLAQRQEAGLYRSLQTENNLIDFCSNDYLGFARSPRLTNLVTNELAKQSQVLNGATGSRLLSGNTQYAEELENDIATYHNADAALLFNSGYDANLGLLSALPQRGDTVIHDELAHASIIDGIRLSNASRFSFKHNDAVHLEQKLQNAKGNCFIVVESVYSMDGDLAPLQQLAALAQNYNAALIVDEAHALGVFGNGLVAQAKLENHVFARVVTFGKALGCHGAVVLGNNILRNYLINFARSFIYTTAAPAHQLATIKMAYNLLQQSQPAIQQLQDNIALYNKLMQPQVNQLNLSAIKTLVIGGNEQTRNVATLLRQSGFDVRAILSPTVPQGTERLRICLHEYNTSGEIATLAAKIKDITNA